MGKIRSNGVFPLVKGLLSVMLVLTGLLTTGCEKEEPVEYEIVLPATPILSNDSSWAVVTDSYLRITEERDKNSTVVATLRKGDILEIIQSQLDSESSLLWYEVRGDGIQGWVYGTSVKEFENRRQAETAGQEAEKETP